MTSSSRRSSQEQFGRTATRYASSTTHASTDSLVDLKEFVGTDGAHYHVGVDIGTGPGFTAFAIAPYCDHVIATDVTPQMLEEVRRLRHDRSAPDTQMALAAAEALPFADASVDVITCRTAAHHFVDLHRWLREVARVLRPSGLLVIGDTCAPEDHAVADWMHEIEVKRDASHVRNLTPSEWRAAVAEAGLEVTDVVMSYVYLQWPDWTVRAGMSEEASAALRDDMLNAPAAARDAFAFTANDDGTVDFHWDVVVVRAVKRDAV